MSASVYYTLFVFNKDTNKWEDVFGAFTRAECVEEGQEYFGQRKHILKSDGTHAGLMKNYAELGQPLHGLEPSNGATVIAATQFPHEGDKHLWTVLCEWNGQFVVWDHNTQDGGCYYGLYPNSLEQARISYNTRVNNHKRLLEMSQQREAV